MKVFIETRLILSPYKRWLGKEGVKPESEQRSIGKVMQGSFIDILHFKHKGNLKWIYKSKEK